ncbi:MAG: helix-turn-helix domain-containing protein [Candidatus Micrarchaeota archaeon]
MEALGMEQKKLDGFAAAAAAAPFTVRTPSISPFKGATLLVLRFLYINKSGYASQIARHCQITAARACQVLKEMELKGLVESTTTEKDCRYCAGTGRKNYGTQSAGCIYCENGKTTEKTYPLFYRITDSAAPAVAGVFNAIYEISATATLRA